MEVWHAELHEERELLEAIPFDYLYIVHTLMITITVRWSLSLKISGGACPSGVTHATPTYRVDVSCPAMLYGRRPQLRI
eukprot:8678054-Pyramimonas_sp.AAC.1